MIKINILIIMFIVVIIVLPVNAQINLGLIGGVNFSNMNTDPEPEGMELSTLYAFAFGGVIDVGLSESFKLCVEPMYLVKGAKTGIENSNIKIKLSYIEVPLMLKYSFGSGKNIPYLMAGPTIGYNLSAKVEDNSWGYSEDIKDTIKDTDIGFGFGAGVNLSAGNGFIFFEARYSLGLTNINDNPEEPDTEVKTSGFQIFTGFTLPFNIL